MTRRPWFVPATATPPGRLFFLATMGPALVCAGLEISRVHGGVVTDYGADLFGTAWIYTAFRLRPSGRFPWRWLASPVRVAGVTFVSGTASEFAQRAGLITGTYDPFDVLTYALALAACLVLERVLGPFVLSQRHPALGAAS